MIKMPLILSQSDVLYAKNEKIILCDVICYETRIRSHVTIKTIRLRYHGRIVH